MGPSTVPPFWLYSFAEKWDLILRIYYDKTGTFPDISEKRSL
jgi:hypothetical protein